MNPILDLLHHRRSNKKLGDLAPNAEQLNNLFKAALRVPDHGRLKPYRFVVIEKSQMATFKNCLDGAVQEFGLDAHKAEKISHLAPMVIGVVAKIDENNPKVPAWEQMLTAGCATYAMQLAANAQGFDTVWITNKWINGSALRNAFACAEQDQIVALLMIGSPREDDQIARCSECEDPTDFVAYLK
ncbi:nitroreductase [Haemophilus paracuniculus]|uniref:Putative NAD(P)H nitroreductase n=1 Tax=Haemophilus paracuniculus TaxID=734 RepID=A0A1T0APX4_9PAST|nr:nitroreductase family protein [Haemophilus paracuniculus]OOR98128.1 nitroreductase [Haemophilus paracuniculus]